MGSALEFDPPESQAYAKRIERQVLRVRGKLEAAEALAELQSVQARAAAVGDAALEAALEEKLEEKLEYIFAVRQAAFDHPRQEVYNNFPIAVAGAPPAAAAAVKDAAAAVKLPRWVTQALGEAGTAVLRANIVSRAAGQAEDDYHAGIDPQAAQAQAIFPQDELDVSEAMYNIMMLLGSTASKLENRERRLEQLESQCKELGASVMEQSTEDLIFSSEKKEIGLEV